ncbi:hypothetical protein E1A91_A04G121200v1 [Gossypium mustelinum]|uniref:Uncharacterized protein n=1 Tax=Gossypium mustelinum TaxID=34275 RepID=A0A5D2ZPD9_GOSMU|nr:hypothetical protein E1A91_A04G121200v1 [Gossypium mustelinum]
MQVGVDTSNPTQFEVHDGDGLSFLKPNYKIQIQVCQENIFHLPPLLPIWFLLLSFFICPFLNLNQHCSIYLSKLIVANENILEKKHDFYSTKQNEDFAALEQVVTFSIIGVPVSRFLIIIVFYSSSLGQVILLVITISLLTQINIF